MVGSVVPMSAPPGMPSVTLPPLTLLTATPSPLANPVAGKVKVMPDVTIRMLVPIVLVLIVWLLPRTDCPLDCTPGWFDKSANEPDVATVAKPETSAAGTLATAVNTDVPAPFT